MYLPLELLHQIFNYLDGDHKTLSSLRSVDKQICQIVTPKFWETNTLKLVKGVNNSISQMRKIIDTDLHLHIKSLTITSSSFWAPVPRKRCSRPTCRCNKGINSKPSQKPFDPNNRSFRSQRKRYLATIIELLETCQNLTKLSIKPRSTIEGSPRDRRDVCWGKLWVAQILPVVAKLDIPRLCIEGAGERAFKKVFDRRMFLRGLPGRDRYCRRLVGFTNLESLEVRITECPGNLREDLRSGIIRSDARAYFFERGYNPRKESNCSRVDLELKQSYGRSRSGGTYSFKYNKKF
ncbi:hypothetical protein TWF106_000410 [Orbilia oligospora]|uniref:F-box domain-containing protein n=1 Tax=Orbilia oligospora TaxID=2813651 RepID=A0A7C8UGM6_ORBOL|nr:hypothetical protein TWF106_000410 [Orbilia oligospora]